MGDIKRVFTSCAHDCGGKCPLEAHVEDGRVVKMAVRREWLERTHSPACKRGLNYTDRLYDPNRLKTPLIRDGERGSGRFREASWDEALTHVANGFQDIIARRGNEGLTSLSRTGAFSALLNDAAPMGARFMDSLGGYTEMIGGYSMDGARVASSAMYGTVSTDHSRDDMLHSRLIILWGLDPINTRHGSSTPVFVRQALAKGIPVIAIDPVKTATAKIATRWIAPRPGTDTAVLVAMAHVLIAEGLVDQAFLDRFTHGYDNFRDYVTGKIDGTPKTPDWAAAISGVDAETIRWLARSYGSTKPASLIPGWGPQRSAQGEQFTRLCSTLACMTGNLGVHGGNPAGGGWGPAPSRGFAIPRIGNKLPHRVRLFRWADMLIHGKAGGYPADVKGVYCIGGNLITQHGHVAKSIQALMSLEFLVVQDVFPTPVARYADVVLPACTFLEREDMQVPWCGHGNFIVYQQKAIEPMWNTRVDYEIAAELAERMGAGEAFTGGRTPEQWLRKFAADIGIPDFEAFRESGIHHFPELENFVSLTDHIHGGKPFDTPSGKIEITISANWNPADPSVPPYPVHQPIWEGPEDPIMQDFPLQMVTPHDRRNINSTIISFGQTPPELRIHPADAGRYGIATGETVAMVSPRGRITAVVEVTDEVREGVVALPPGHWHPDQSPEEWMATTANALTSDRPTRWGQCPTLHTCAVRLEKLSQAAAAAE